MKEIENNESSQKPVGIFCCRLGGDEGLGRKNNRKRVHIRPVRIRLREAQHPYPKHPRRGQVWFADLGSHEGTSVQAGERPVLIFSNDIGNAHSETVTVIPLTSRLKKLNLPTHVRLSTEECSGLDIDSVVLAEQITTIGLKDLINAVGFVESETAMKKVAEAVKVQLGI